MLVVLEGLDGVGKSLQTRLLQEYFALYQPEVLHFPRHHQRPFGDLISRFLHGDLGDIEATHPALVALLFACDQFDYMKNIDTKEDLVILDRYYYSNMAYHSAKFSHAQERLAFRQWLADVSKIFSLPPADLLFYLELPDTLTSANLEQRTADGKSDHYERDLSFQARVREAYQAMLAEEKNVVRIACAQPDGTWRSAQEIHLEMVQHIERWLEENT
ncbi:dTMP kinase [Entomospira culicis]|uniref:Thymidylate kinase n=1 Tax=Entomospira culicis TaxID=2719989 RepID=A0A968GEG4_9SPIO|nr:hypothetical protein [Entomospira culicis]NIZ18803.1 hypothetical protein [Entomospira culicis]NIZ69018.1 hypothetical protein [Entomospira culicis]WDI37608.1 hypothetical protein PVA46_02135 [Entomospira culicis]WDI39236.1 hypothetical protein PVA47_02140 [Entomospira culicis]